MNMKEEMGRTKNSILNGVVGILLSVATTIMAFVVRTVFISCLDGVYLGVNGLFSNILTLLSLAELGIGNAIIFQLYRPIAQNDIVKLQALVRFYKKCYVAIALFILIVGMLLIPFLPLLVSSDTPIANLEVIYFIYLLDTVSTYLWVYKSALMTAYQRNRIVSIFALIQNAVTSFVQILVLILFGNFYVYLIVKILFTLLFQFLLSKKVDKDYSEITRNKGSKLSKQEIKTILLDVKSIFAFKIGSAVLNASDNLIISAFISTLAVGVYSNYYMIISAVKTIVVKFLHGFTASIGNLYIEENNKKKVRVFLMMNYLAFSLYGFCAICLITLTTDFVNLWIGDNYVFDTKILNVLVIVFYISGMQTINITYRETSGIFKLGKIRPIISSVVNIILSIWWAKVYGLLGVFLATVVAELSTYWYDAYLVCKHALFTDFKKYIMKYCYYFIITCISCFVVYQCCSLIHVHTIFEFIYKTIATVCMAALTICICSIPCKEFRYFLTKFRSMK